MFKLSPTRILLSILLLLAVVMLMASCSSVRKSQATHRATSDSTHRLIKDSTHLVTSDSGHLQQSDSIHNHNQDSTGVSSSKNTTTTEVTIWIDTAYHGNDYPARPEDYVPDTTTRITVFVTGDETVSVDIGNRKALKVVATRTSTAEHTDSTHLKTFESTQVKKSDSSFHHDSSSSSSHLEEDTSISKTEVSSSKSSFRIRWPAVIIAGAGIVIFFLWKRFRKKAPI